MMRDTCEGMMMSPGEGRQDDSIPVLQLETDVGFGFRAEEELEKVNIVVEECNQCGKEFHLARSTFSKLFQKAKERLDKLYNANKKHIEIARPFFRAKENASKAKDNFIDAAARYRTCCVQFEEARENAATAEKAFMASFQMSSSSKVLEGTQDPEVLINLNKANEKVFEASKVKSAALGEQQNRMELLSSADHAVALLGSELSKHILKARSYFETRDSYQRTIDNELVKLRECYSHYKESKERYRITFSRIHVISAEFEQRLGQHHKIQNNNTDLSKFEEVEDPEDLEADFFIDTNLEETILDKSHNLDTLSTNSTVSDLSHGSQDNQDVVRSESLDNLAAFDELSLEPNENETPEISSCSLSFQWQT